MNTESSTTVDDKTSFEELRQLCFAKDPQKKDTPKNTEKLRALAGPILKSIMESPIVDSRDLIRCLTLFEAIQSGGPIISNPGQGIPERQFHFFTPLSEKIKSTGATTAYGYNDQRWYRPPNALTEPNITYFVVLAGPFDEKDRSRKKDFMVIYPDGSLQDFSYTTDDISLPNDAPMIDKEKPVGEDIVSGDPGKRPFYGKTTAGVSYMRKEVGTEDIKGLLSQMAEAIGLRT